LILNTLSEEAMDMREAIDGHIANVNGSVGNILSDNSNMTKAAEASKRLSIVGAVTTDFTFYSKFKRDIEAMTEYDNIVVAAQEHAANTLVLLCILLRTEKWQMLYRQSVWLYASINHISAVYVTGIAGSGKSLQLYRWG
jgi:hypothetical protein